MTPPLPLKGFQEVGILLTSRSASQYFYCVLFIDRINIKISRREYRYFISVSLLYHIKL